MSRRTNEEVKIEIENALLALMKKAKPFSRITITDIIKEAHVARACYYRNFESKEDVVRSYLLRLRAEILQDLDFSDDYLHEITLNATMTTFLQYCLSKQDLILLIYSNGLWPLLLEEANYYTEERLGDMPSRSPEQYFLYFFSAGFLNALIYWLKKPAGKREQPEKIAGIFIKFYDGFQK